MKIETQISEYKLSTMKRRLGKYLFCAVAGLFVAHGASTVYAESKTDEAKTEAQGEIQAEAQVEAAQAEEGNTSEGNVVAARVNGVPIVMKGLSKQSDSDLGIYKNLGANHSDGSLSKYMRMKELDKIISFELLYQEAKKYKIDDLDVRVDKTLTEIKNNNKEKYQTYDEQGLRDAVTKRIYVDEYLQKKNLIVTEVPESEVIEYYNKNKEAFKGEEKVQTRHILVRVLKEERPEDIIKGIPDEYIEHIPPEKQIAVKGNGVENKAVDNANDTKESKKVSKEELYKKIAEAKRLIEEGKPFAEVAKEYSDCGSALAGGDLGYHQRGYMPKEFDELAFSLEPNKLSDIIETKHGYHVLEVLDRRPAGVNPYEDVKDFITRYLIMTNRDKVMAEHISALKEKAKIEVYL